ncbi:testis-expressed protein 2-like isoform X1 [Anguilla anguilla]|uniref:testis-expressed protein 2-like isoform X1 n=1 Tax=Anguilla anguilla TaxID=7936 RepID=UPI0015B2ABAB|nr:testis-expressed protein 2-like isoform X1 [Anguilla anguilla]
MSSRGHADRSGPMSSRLPAMPKLPVPRSASRETVAVHFSALGKEEEEEEEALREPAAPPPPRPPPPAAEYDPSVVTAEEASEDLFEAEGVNSAGAGSSSAPPPAPPPAAGSAHSPAYSAPERRVPPPRPPPISGSSPSRSTAPASRPFLSLVKSLSVDEPREGVAVPPTTKRQLMKTLVKSLSTESSGADQDPSNPSSSSSSSFSSSSRIPDSLLGLQLFRQFTQPRAAALAAAAAAAGTVAGGDSKTAPSSPAASPDSRPFFTVQEVEARLEDTRRRLSEVMYEPLQRLSKIMGDEGGGARLKGLSSSATELTSLAGFNGLAESNNNNYCIKEEEGLDWEGEIPTGGAGAGAGSPGRATGTRYPSRGQDTWSMSALARQDDEEFVELYSDCVDGEAEPAAASEPRPPQEESRPEEEEEAPDVPYMTLIVLTSLLYCCFILPLPTYLGGALLGAALGFMLAMLFVWLAAPRRSGNGPQRATCSSEAWNVAHLDVKEPDIFKGWMNQIQSYDPETYHATLTQSVFVRLEGSSLRLSKPNRNIARRATFNEPKPDVSYISQKIYDLTDSNIYLVPSNLATKRVWNKKYPICIELGKLEDFMSQTQTSKGGADEEWTAAAGVGEMGEVSGGSEEPKRPHGTPERGWASAPGGDGTLFLFGRTGREKEEWFRRMTLASKLKSEARKPQSLPGSRSAFVPAHSRSSSQSGGLSHSRSSSRSSLDELLASQPRPRELSGGGKQKALLDYSVYMAQYVPGQPATPTSSPVHSAESSPGASKKLPSSPKEEAEPDAWVNALLGRIFWDFLGEKYWANVVSKKIQMKLSKIRLPYFMNELTLTELDMGVAVPKILQASKPSVDHQGLWFDLEISYTGSFLMTLQTKMNLARLGKEGEGLRFGEPGKDGSRPRVYCLADSDEESSSAGSSDEEETPEVPTEKSSLLGAEGYAGGHRPSKIMRFVDKIAKSKYFQKATETEFIKKKMEEVSNTPLLLTVEVQECRGTLAVNIPPPPTDRIWYGFRSPPHLELKARPKLGEREVTLAHVTDWIEKKLDQEFRKVFVMPNMDDVWLPIMHSATDTRSNAAAMTAAVATAKDPCPADAEGVAPGENVKGLQFTVLKEGEPM